MRLRSPLQVLLLSAAALVGACDKHDLATATSAPGGSSVSIIGLDPVEEQPLQPGSKVRVACRVAYTLTGDKSGQLALIAQSHSGDLLASTFVPITPATGNQELSVEFVVGGFKSEAQRLVNELKLRACENWPRSERTPPEGSETRA